METLVTDITLYGALTSVAILAITELTTWVSKQFGQKVPAQYVVLFLAMFVAGAYQAYTQFLPAEVQDAIYAFVAGSAGFATLIYTFLIKPIKKNLASKGLNT